MRYALTKDEQLFDAAEAIKGKAYYCPSCHQKVLLKKGKSYRPYFAHRCKDPALHGEGETGEHLKGKELLEHLFKDYGVQVATEAYLDKIKQRPDVLVHFSDNTKPDLAVEFQCAPLSLEKLVKRSRGYQSLGLNFVWFLGHNYRPKKRLTQQSAQFMRWSKNCGFYLIFLEPFKRRFEIIYDIQKADFLPLDYKIFYAYSIAELKCFFKTVFQIFPHELTTLQIRRQTKAITKELYYSRGRCFKVQKLLYQNRASLEEVLEKCLLKTTELPLYRGNTFWWRALCYVEEKQLSKKELAKVCYKLPFIKL